MKHAGRKVEDPLRERWAPEKGPLTLSKIYMTMVGAEPKKTAFVFFNSTGERKTMTFEEYDRAVRKTAQQLSEKLSDVTPSSYIALKMANSPTWCIFFFALLATGHPVLLLHNALTKQDVSSLMKEARATAIITNDQDVCATKVIRPFTVSMENSDDTALSASAWADRFAFVSSGTSRPARIYEYTGKECGAFLAVCPELRQRSGDLIIARDSRVLVNLPLAHVYGFVTSLFITSCNQNTLVFPPSSAMKDVRKVCQKEKITNIYSVPLFYNSLVRTFKEEIRGTKKEKLVETMIAHGKGIITATEAGAASKEKRKKKIRDELLGPSIRFLVTGGAFIAPDTLAFLNGLGFYFANGYGTSETLITFVDLAKDPKERLKGSIGQPLFLVEHQIVEGELLLRSPYLHHSLLKDGVTLPPLKDEDGWYRTGDGAREKDGAIFLAGRLDDVIIGADGENIFLDAIELAYHDLKPARAMTTIETTIDKQTVVGLLVNMKPRWTIEDEKKLREAIEEKEKTIPPRERARVIFLTEKTLPTNATRKIMRRKVIKDMQANPEAYRRLERHATHDPSSQSITKNDDMLKRVIPLYVKTFKVKEEDIAPMSDPVLDLGGDSYGCIALLQAVEDEFDVKIPLEEIGRIRTPEQVTAFLRKTKDQER